MYKAPNAEGMVTSLLKSRRNRARNQATTPGLNSPNEGEEHRCPYNTSAVSALSGTRLVSTDFAVVSDS